MERKYKLILASLITLIFAFLALIIAMLVLVSDRAAANTHLSAGSLTATLERTKLVSYTLNPDSAEFELKTNDDVVDFTGNKGNIFGLTTSDKVYPGNKYTATMKLTNQGSVSFGYYMVVELKGGSNALSDQLKVTVTVDGQALAGTVTQGLNVGSEKKPIGILQESTTAEFEVTVEFIDITDGEYNNAAQDQSCYFDLTVYAAQEV